MLRITYVSFPGLGIDEFKLDSVAVRIFGWPIAWYGIIITTGIILATLYVLYRAKQEMVDSKESACQRRKRERHGLDPWVKEIPCGRK